MLVTRSTPIEEYRLGRRKVFVKREDLCAEQPAPPLGKLRGMLRVVDQMISNGANVIGCWDTRVSKLGIGLAVTCASRGVKSVVCYPHLKNGTTPDTIKMAENLGAEIVRLRGNHISICYSQATQIVEKMGGVMIPFGLECEESVEEIAKEAATVPERIAKNSTIVISCGSGVTVSGVIRGLPQKPRSVIGVSAGRSKERILRCVKKYVNPIPDFLTVLPNEYAYDLELKEDCPFPCHPNYDLKAWKFLKTNIARLPRPLLFWNIGA